MNTARPYDTAALDKLAEDLRSALVSDILDGLGYRNQSLEPGLRPTVEDQVLVGYAYPTVVEIVDAPPEVPYIGLLDALDNIGTDEVWVASTSSDAAIWGELTSTAIRFRGARGTIADGYIRDTPMVREMGFPVFSRGTSPRDANGRIEQRRVSEPIDVAGVSVAPGDLIVGDDDGVVVVPAALIEQVVDAALAKSADESLFRVAVREGMKPSDAFEKFGVL
ncbi:RraA family protein [Nocardioides humilatus]|uniref:Putative 4-hydroxy-4-methyl-2-oxoglutarate aldolase n=1 Tax=Nocardioides humilatus TaxID=2607660 RepID=A0A5B1LQ30_9ACTN|nr:RraA family protein [Nocardioides humilatus]KAA1421799.1 RraA family protein [Nocardioides humilatus]